MKINYNDYDYNGDDDDGYGNHRRVNNKTNTQRRLKSQSKRNSHLIFQVKTVK